VRRWLRYLLWTGFFLLVAAVIAAFSLYRAARHVPKFYRELLVDTLPGDQQVVAGDQLERAALELHNQARQESNWEATFIDQAINAWLATELPQKFPRALPAGTSEPRVRFDENRFQAAVTYTIEGIPVVVSLAGDLYLTEQPNEIALRIRSLRAGLLPLPLKRVLSGASEAAGQADLVLRWSQHEGDPVALLRLPADATEADGKPIRLESLILRPHEISLSGRTGTPSGR
jgi:hypothetical protein